jgi:hypothetical protein
VRNNHDPLRGQPRRIAFVDTETVPKPGKRFSQQVHSLRVGVAVFGNWNGSEFESPEWFRFSSAADFWEWLTLRLSWQRKVTLYAHNAHFDLTILDWWNQVLDGNFRMETDSSHGQKVPAKLTKNGNKWRGMVVLEKNPYFIQAFNARGRLDIVDTTNYYKQSLKSLGESIGLAKLPMPESEASEQDWYDYCERDVLITQRVMCNLLRLWNSSNLGPFAYTLPSLAFRAWRYSFCDILPVAHDNSDIRSLERSAYFGGRSSAWYIGDIVPVDYNVKPHIASENSREYAQLQGQVYILDVRSMYPSVMLRKQYPIKFLHHISHPTIAQTIDLMLDYCLVANVTIRTNDQEYPYRTGERVIYPVGQYNTSLCTPELHYAIDSGAIVSVNDLAIYSAGYPFDSYITYWWNKREISLQAGDEVESDICKLMLNSLYGRFGQRAAKWVSYHDKMGEIPWGQWWEINAQTGNWIHWRSIGYYSQRMQERGEHKNACTAVAAHVTSYGRMKMRFLRSLCPPRSVLYQDTDSLFVLADGMLALKSHGYLNGTGLGDLRLTHVVNHMQIRGIKNYCADGREVISGINTENPQFGPRVYLAPEFSGPSVLLHSGLSATISVDQIVKRVHDYHYQDSIDRDGYTISPLLL